MGAKTPFHFFPCSNYKENNYNTHMGSTGIGHEGWEINVRFQKNPYPVEYTSKSCITGTIDDV